MSAVLKPTIVHALRDGRLLGKLAQQRVGQQHLTFLMERCQVHYAKTG